MQDETALSTVATRRHHMLLVMIIEESLVFVST